MVTTALREYFEPDGQRLALEAYAGFARGSDWSVAHKMDLYEASRAAFGPGVSADAGRPAFDTIYRSLVSHWQVFRPQGAAGPGRRNGFTACSVTSSRSSGGAAR